MVKSIVHSVVKLPSCFRLPLAPSFLPLHLRLSLPFTLSFALSLPPYIPISLHLSRPPTCVCVCVCVSLSLSLWPVCWCVRTVCVRRWGPESPDCGAAIDCDTAPITAPLLPLCDLNTYSLSFPVCSSPPFLFLPSLLPALSLLLSSLYTSEDFSIQLLAWFQLCIVHFALLLSV